MREAARKLGFAVRALTLDFENRDLALLGIARIGTSFASWCFAIALGVYGFEAHGALGVGLVAVVRLLPGALTSPFAGLLSDRFPRRSVLLGASLAMAAVLAAAADAAAFDAPASVVFVFPALLAIVSSAYAPAESALMTTMARTPQELSASNVTHSAMENVGFLLAALATGVLLALTSPAVIFGVAAAAMVLVAIVIAIVAPDRRPEYVSAEFAGVLRETGLGLRTLFLEQPPLRLSATVLTLLIFFEGFADVMVVVVALDLLHLEEGSVGFLNAIWGIGAIAGGAGLALLLDRGKLVIAIADGSLVIGAATVLPGAWPVPAAAYAGWAAIGVGFTFVEVAGKTLLQRLSSDETFGRVVSSLEASRLMAMALGSISAVLLISLLDVRGALIALGLLLPAFVVLCWSRLRAFEVGAPVAEVPYGLLRRNSIFSPLPVATLERLSHDLVPLEAKAGEDVIVQGEIGDRFFLIESGEVEVFENGAFRRNEGPGESFGEIALLHNVARTATVRTTADSRLLVLERDQFLRAVTGHGRSHQVAHTVVSDRWDGPEVTESD
jgi:MFS family permease